MTELFTKDVHYSQDFETSVIGVCLMERHTFARIYGLLNEEAFYFDKNKEVFRSMKWLYENNAPIDILTVCDELVRRRGFKDFYGYSVGQYLMISTMHVCSSAHVEYHCHCLQEMYLDREITRLTYSGPGNGSNREKIVNLQNRLMALNMRTDQQEWFDMAELMIKLFEHREKMKERGPGIPTGITRLDKTNGGFMPGDMIVIGARPSIGKSALAGTIAWNMASKGYKVGFISLEMNNAKIAGRLAALDTNTDFHILYRGLEFDEAHQKRLYDRIANNTAQLPIYVSDKTQVNIHEIKTKAIKLKNTKGCDILFIDYLQLVDGDGSAKNRTRENEVQVMSKGIKIMAKELDIPIVALCQLNREVTNRHGGDRFPRLSDLRESGSIEQDADVVMFLHRDWMSGIQQKEDGSSTEREADLIVRKWRDGEANLHIPFEFDPPKMKFTERKDLTTWRPVKSFTETEKDDNPF